MTSSSGRSSSGRWRDEWSATFREWRHNHCVMRPVSAVILFAMGLVAFVGMICQIPQFLLGLVMGPLLRRGNWLIEFLYPTRLVGWGHILLVKWARQRQGAPGTGGGKKKSDGTKGDYLSGHSRTLEQRVEVVRGRVYIHCIPMLMDNIAYLIVYCPKEDEASSSGRNEDEGLNSTRKGRRRPLIGLVVDCGDADDVADAVSHIRRAHYSNRPMQIAAILSTHKHHDHTAGNRALVDDHFPGSVKHVYGGAVERVPCCTDLVTDGDILSLPGGIRMSEVMEIEAIATPSHTRGSIVYALRNKPQSRDDDAVTYLFTGDSMFCGGGGVPFEADLDDKNAQQQARHIRPNAGIKSVERCFAQILSRAGPTGKVLLFPGHEYTSDLLQRQFDPRSEFGKGWGSVTPRTFFDTASYFFVSHHRRTLPRGTRLLTVPAPLRRELHINPHFRSLTKRGHHLLQALDFWRKHCVETVEEEFLASLSGVDSTRRSGPSCPAKKDGGMKVVIRDASNRTTAMHNKTPSTKSRWNLTNDDVRRDVFATVYASDLERLIYDLRAGTVTNERAADRLSEMTSKLDEPVVTRRPVPGTLPSDKSIHLGILALVVLGSPPAAMTPSDGERMNLPRPTSLTDRILISKSRLLRVLCRLGLIVDEGSRAETANLLELLWEYSAAEDLTLEVSSSTSSPSETTPTDTATSSDEGRSSARTKKNYSSVDGHDDAMEGGAASAKNDEIELGLLKIALYGASPSAPPSCFSRLCQPCGGGGGGARKKKTSSSSPSPSPPTTPRRDQTLSERMGGTMRQSGAELVKHDVCSCPMCRDVVGCPQSEERLDVMKAQQNRTSGGGGGGGSSGGGSGSGGSSVAKMLDDIKSNMGFPPQKKDSPIPDNENVEMEMFAFRPPEE